MPTLLLLLSIPILSGLALLVDHYARNTATQDEFVPQALDLERLDAIRFDKGCFPGQEIAARLHFRGGAKQRLRRVTLRGAGEVAPGLRIEASGGSAGIVLYGAPSREETFEALAVIGDAATGDTTLTTAHGHVVHLKT